VANVGSVLFSFLNEIGLFDYLFLLFLFALSSCDVALGWLPNEIFLWYLLALLFEYPVVLVVIIVTTLVHEILEDFPHVVVVWSFFKL
jgi:hypothetical protein